jgi:hypothetical protein
VSESYTIFIPVECRRLWIVVEDRVIKAPGEIREIEVDDMGTLASKHHTQGDTKVWKVSYEDWLDNAAMIEQADVQSSSPTCTVSDIEISGPRIVFLLTGGTLNERVTVTLTMSDNFGNIKHDTIFFTVVAA